MMHATWSTMRARPLATSLITTFGLMLTFPLLFAAPVLVWVVWMALMGAAVGLSCTLTALTVLDV